MQDNDRVALARQIAAAVFDMAERDQGLSNPRLTETIASIIAEFQPDNAYRDMIGRLFAKPRPEPIVKPSDWNSPYMIDGLAKAKAGAIIRIE